MALDLAGLQAALAEDDSVNHSAITLITQLLADVESHAGDEEAVRDVIARYRAQTAELAAAVATVPPAPPSAKK